MRNCSIEGCDKPHYGRGYCNKHYQRLRTHGDPKCRTKVTPHVRLFLDEVVMNHSSEECLIWPYTKASGRPQVKVNGKMVNVCRVVCERVCGLAPTRAHHAAHSCGNGHLGCVTPLHLSWKTAKENEADKHIHGTARYGERGTIAKLTNDQARQILAMKGLLAQRKIAGLFGVSQKTVQLIHCGKTWRRVLNEGLRGRGE